MQWCREQRRARMEAAKEEARRRAREAAQAAVRERRQGLVSASTRALSGSQSAEGESAVGGTREKRLSQRRRQGQGHVRSRVGEVLVGLLAQLARAAHEGTGVCAQRSGVG